MSYLSLIRYVPPNWAIDLNNIPNKRVVLANVPTPIHEWKVPDIPSEIKLFIKRDDLSGCALGGNKVRKLEFLLAEALEQGCKSVVTGGKLLSNHCLATAVACRELGLDTHLVLRADKEDFSIDHPGNHLLTIMCGSKLYFVPKKSFLYLDDIKPKMQDLRKEIQLKTGYPVYLVPHGGTNTLSTFGYIEAWEEMMKEHNVIESFDDIIVTNGSGGTVAGLAIGNYLTGQHLRIHAMSITDDLKQRISSSNDILFDVGLTDKKIEELVDFVDVFQMCKNGVIKTDDYEFCSKISSETGIFCDPFYTGRALSTLLHELERNSKRFQGTRILFIHTGGFLSLYHGGMQGELTEKFCGGNTFVWDNDSPVYKRLFK